MEITAKTEEQARQERAIAWTKRMLESKHQLERKMDEDVQLSPKIKAVLQKLRAS